MQHLADELNLVPELPICLSDPTSGSTVPLVDSEVVKSGTSDKLSDEDQEEQIVDIEPCVDLEFRRALMDARGLIEKLRSQRDFHRISHKRVQIERDRLHTDMKRMKVYYERFEPELESFKKKYECAMKQLSLVRIERDRLLALQPAIVSLNDSPIITNSCTPAESVKFSPWPSISSSFTIRPDLRPATVCEFTVQASEQAVSRLAVFETTVATGADDGIVKLFSMKEDERVDLKEDPGADSACCELREIASFAHDSFVAGLGFHPSGRVLYATTGCGQIHANIVGQESVSLKSSDACVWSIAVHPDGSYAATGSMDHCCRLIDLAQFKVRSTLRGLSDSINAVTWFGSSVLAGSADKAVALFDPRARRLAHRIVGHGASVNTVVRTGDATFCSGDSEGTLLGWDVRNLTCPMFALSAGAGINGMSSIALACADGQLRYHTNGVMSHTTEVMTHRVELLDCCHTSGDAVLTSNSAGFLALFRSTYKIFFVNVVYLAMLGASLVQKFLVQSLSAYFDDVDRDNVSASLLRGDMSLSNVHLRKSVVDHLGLSSVNLVHGTVGLLRAKVPWHKFGAAPIVIEIENLFVLLESRIDGFATTNRAAELAAMEHVGVEARDLLEPTHEEIKSGWRGWVASAGRAAKRLIEFVEIRVHIQKVHIRYTADTFVAGITLERLVLSTTSQRGAPKVLTLEGLAIYCNPDDTVLQDASEELDTRPSSPSMGNQYVLAPVSGSVTTRIDPSGTVIVSGSFDAIVIQLSKEQLSTSVSGEIRKLLVSTAKSGRTSLNSLNSSNTDSVNSSEPAWLEVSLELGEAVFRSVDSARGTIDFTGNRLMVRGEFWDTHSELSFRMAQLTVLSGPHTILSTDMGGEFVSVILRKSATTDLVFTLGPVAVQFRPQIVSDVILFIKDFPSEETTVAAIGCTKIQFCWEAMAIDWYANEALTCFAKSRMSSSYISLELWETYFVSRGELGDFSVHHVDQIGHSMPILSLANSTDSYLFKFYVRSFDPLLSDFPGHQTEVHFDLNAVRLVAVRAVLFRLWDFVFEAFLPAIVGQYLTVDAPTHEEAVAANFGFLLTVQVEALEVELPLQMGCPGDPFRLVLRRLSISNRPHEIVDVIDFELEEVEMSCLGAALLPSLRLTASLFRETPMKMITRIEQPVEVNLSRAQFCFLADLLAFNILATYNATHTNVSTELPDSPWFVFEFEFAPVDLCMDTISRLTTAPVSLRITKFAIDRLQIDVATVGVTWHDGGVLMGSVDSVSFGLDSDSIQRSILVSLENPKFIIHLARMLRLRSFFFDDFPEYHRSIAVVAVAESVSTQDTILNVNLSNALLVLPVDASNAGFNIGATLLAFNQTWSDGNLHRKLVGNSCEVNHAKQEIGNKIDIFLSSIWDSGTNSTLRKCSCEPIELRLRFSHLRDLQAAIELQQRDVAASSVPVAPGSNNVTFGKVDTEIFFHSISVLVVNDFALLQNTPLFNLNLRNVQQETKEISAVDVVRATKVLSLDVGISVFNKASVDWEPLIECVNTGAFVKLQVTETNYAETSTLIQSSQLVVEVLSGGLQLNVTDALIQTVIQHAKDWQGKTPTALAENPVNGGLVFAPYSVANHTGESEIVVTKNDSMFTVSNRSEVCLTSVGVEVGGARRRVLARVAGARWALPRVPLDKPGLYLFSVTTSGDRLADLVARVSVTVDGRKLLRLESAASVVNLFGVPIWLKVGTSYEVLIQPGDSAPIPLGECEAGIMRIRLEDSAWSGSVSIASVADKPKLWQVSANAQFMYISGRKTILSYQDKTVGQMTISVFAPVRLRSTIPVMVDFHVAAESGVIASGSIPLNGECFITLLPLTGRLVVRFAAFEGTFASPDPVQIWPANSEHIREDAKEFYLPIKLVDGGKNFLHLRLFYDQIGGQPPRLTLHSPQWLMCADVPRSLRFAYDSADEWAADSWGGIQWVAAPESRTYAVPLDCKAKKIGAYLGDSHSEYVAVDTVGATASITVRQERRRESVDALKSNEHRRGSIDNRRGSIDNRNTSVLVQELAVRVTSSASGMVRDFPVKITTVSPRYVLVNTLSDCVLSVRQSEQISETLVQPNVQVPFKWWVLTAEPLQRLLQVSKVTPVSPKSPNRRSSRSSIGYSVWSEAIGVDEIGESLVQGVDQLRVEVRIFHGVFYIVFSDTVDLTQGTAMTTISNAVYRLVLPALAVSLTGPVASRDSDRAELLLLSAKTLALNLSLSPIANEVDLRCAAIQIDDLRDEPKFPIVWTAARKKGEETGIYAAIEVSAAWAPPKLGDTTLSFESCLIKIGDVDLALDFALISDLTEMFLKATAGISVVNYPYKVVPATEILPVGSLRIWSFKQFLLFGMRVNLSFNPGSTSNISVLHRAIASMAAVERSPLKLKALSLLNFRASRSNMLSIVTEHYKHQLYREMRTIMGSAEAFGNPIGLIGSLSTGVTDLFYEPFAAIRDMQKPEDVVNVADKTAKGAKSFFKNTAFGVFNSFSKLAATSAQTLSILTEDAEYLSERSEFNSKNKPAHFGDGMVVGATSFGRGIISGLSGLVTKPVEGMEQDGFAGFAKGTVKGVGGFFLKPVAGLLDFAKSTADGVVVATKDTTLDVPPIRLPRMLYGHDRCIRVVNPDDSLLRWYLVQLDGIPPNVTYVAHIYDVQNGTIVAASSTHLIAADTHARRIILLVPIWRVLGVVGDLDRLVLTINVLVPSGTSQLDLELSSVFVLKSVQQLIATAMEIYATSSLRTV